MSQKKSLTNRVATSIYITCFGNSGYQHLERGMSLSQRAARNVIKMVKADAQPKDESLEEQIEYLKKKFGKSNPKIFSKDTKLSHESICSCDSCTGLE
jgi:hypothetical protein